MKVSVMASRVVSNYYSSKHLHERYSKPLQNLQKYKQSGTVTGQSFRCIEITVGFLDTVNVIYYSYILQCSQYRH
jgi:hypothetical protein